MIRVFRIPVPKDKLQAIPSDERVLLLLLGYAFNQLIMLQKLLTFATNRSPDEDFEKYLIGIQTQMLLRIYVGSLFEAWRLIRGRFLSKPFAREYLSKIDQDGVNALDSLKLQFGGGSFLAGIRNDYAFHYPKASDVETAFDKACADPDFDDCWNVYFSDHNFNSSFFLSDLIFIHGIGLKVSDGSPDSAHKKLMSEVLAASSHLVDFARAFFAAAWLRHFGMELLATETVSVEDAPKADDVWLPFFVEPRSSETSNHEDAKGS